MVETDCQSLETEQWGAWYRLFTRDSVDETRLYQDLGQHGGVVAA